MSGEKSKPAYDDIIDLAYPSPLKHPRMDQSDRAAQFSAFAALSGHDAAIKEAGRITGEKIELGEDAIAYLDEQLNRIRARISELPEVSITYFVPDSKKSGGEYVAITGAVKKIDEFERAVVLTYRTMIPIDDIFEIIILSGRSI